MVSESEYLEQLMSHNPQYALYIAESDVRIKATGIQQTVNVMRSLLPKNENSNELAEYLDTIVQFAQEMKHIVGACAVYDKDKAQASSP